jgi:hypothetical protein
LSTEPIGQQSSRAQVVVAAGIREVEMALVMPAGEDDLSVGLERHAANRAEIHAVEGSGLAVLAEGVVELAVGVVACKDELPVAVALHLPAGNEDLAVGLDHHLIGDVVFLTGKVGGHQSGVAAEALVGRAIEIEPGDGKVAVERADQHDLSVILHRDIFGDEAKVSDNLPALSECRVERSTAHELAALQSLKGGSRIRARTMIAIVNAGHRCSSLIAL